MLTPCQAECLSLICEAVAEGQPAPSYRELARAMGKRSVGQIARFIEGLRERGFIAQSPGRYRSITPLRWPDGSAFGASEKAA
jgi:SOS-response transcriptional repressor LexA